MSEVLVVQIDNRPRGRYLTSKELTLPPRCDDRGIIKEINEGLTNKLDFWSVASLINEYKCDELGWNYIWHKTEQNERHVTWNKVKGLTEILLNTDERIILFLDSDAWIRDQLRLREIIREFEMGYAKLLFAHEPEIRYNTKVSTGCIAMKNDREVADFWKRVWEEPTINTKFHQYLYEWCHEQRIVDEILSRNSFKNVTIFPADILNSPCGSVVRHCWWKEFCWELVIDELFVLLCRQLKHSSKIS
jgi:hypothetical protein